METPGPLITYNSLLYPDVYSILKNKDTINNVEYKDIIILTNK
jgi:hypothetical protein